MSWGVKDKLGYGLVSSILTAATVLAPVQSLAVNDHAFFGQSMPASIGNLPPGLFRRQLERLPAPAKARALKWLQDFDFPASDAAFLRADPKGGIFYEDPVHATETAGNDGSSPSIAEVTPSNVFTLHSKPGASRVVYLDMDGHVVSGTVWNANSGHSTLYMEAYDIDGDPSVFDTTEIEHIAETWKRIAEDFAPYDIDVTTEQPPSFGPNVGHILVSPQTDAYGNRIYPNSAGGVAYVGMWGRSNYTYYQPALVFPEYLGDNAKNIAEAGTHELGHNLSLSHDGNSSQGYYYGHGGGPGDETDWAPIMGVGYSANVTQWSIGEYADADNQQDDLAIIAGHLGYRNDDHADIDFDMATPLVRSDSMTISATNPVSDPGNTDSSNKGVIGDRNDVDLFYIDVDAGTIDLAVMPAWIEDFYVYSYRSANLDVRATLYDIWGNVVAEDNPIDDTYARVSDSVPAGRYILAIEGVGVRTPSDGYSDYASIGRYFIDGTVPSDFTYSAPPTAPSDLTASLNIDGNGIDLRWTDPTSSADTNEAGYRVFRQLDGGPWAELTTLPQDSTEYPDNNLGNGIYLYYLEAYNGAGSTASEPSESVTVSAPVSAYATAENTAKGTVLSGSYLNTRGGAGSEVLAETHQGGRPSRRVSMLDHSWNVTGIEPGALVKLEVEAEAPANSDGDDFRFTYALNDGAPIELGVLDNGTGRQTLVATLPSSTAGNLSLRVVDTNRVTGNSAGDSLSIHRIEVSSSGDPEEQSPVVTIIDPTDDYSTMQGAEFDLGATADDYEDGDLSANVSWSSNFDGHLHTGAAFTTNTSEPPLSIGGHVITAEVTDSAGRIGESSVSVTIADPNTPSDSHIAALVGSSQLNRNKWSAIITATVHNDRGDKVANATVSGDWSGAAKGSASCVTDGSGQCSVSKGGLRTSNPSIIFSVTDVAHATLNYSPNINTVSSITVIAP